MKKASVKSIKNDYNGYKLPLTQENEEKLQIFCVESKNIIPKLCIGNGACSRCSSCTVFVRRKDGRCDCTHTFDDHGRIKY
jgi:hypothetical protein